MEKINIEINGIPAIIWGSKSDKLYLYVHGQGGNKEEAESFACIACKYSWQVLSIDLPEHGDRKSDTNAFDPWHVVPELSKLMEYIKPKWSHISLLANSIGAWYSMLSFKNKQLVKCLFVSPILDMEYLISNMMLLDNVSKKQLEEELIITTSSGQMLSLEYLLFARNNPIFKWESPTEILYCKKDNLQSLSVVEKFTHAFNCNLTTIDDGEHWFHTPEQLNILNNWFENCLKKGAF